MNIDGETVTPASGASQSAPSTGSLAATRYGEKRRLPRGWAIAGISTLTLVALVWMLWANFGRGTPPIEFRDLAHSIAEDGSSVEITWEMSVEPGTSAYCALQSLNESFQVVGWKIVPIPASADYTRQFSDTVRTAMFPVTGLVYFCWAS